MPIVEDTTYRGSATSGSASNLSATFGNSSKAAVAGQLLIAAAMIVDTAAHTTKPAGYSNAVGPLDFSGGPALFLCVKQAAGGETGVTFSNSGGATSYAVCCTAANGMLLPMAIDKTATAPTDFASHVLSATGTTGTTVQADELMISACALAGAATSPTVSSPANLIFALQSNELLVSLRALAAQGTFADTFHWTNNNFCEAMTATIKAAPVVLTNDGWEVA